MTSIRIRWTLAIGLLLLTVYWNDCAAGAIAYNSFGPNDSYKQFGNWQGSGFRALEEEVRLAQRFTSLATGPLHKLELGLLFSPPQSSLDMDNVDELTLTLVPDVDGHLGTQVLWSQLYKGNSPTDFGSVAMFDVIDGPTLQANTKYWLISSSTPIGFKPHSWFRAYLPEVPMTPIEPFAIASPGTAGGRWVRLTFPHDPGFALRVTVIPEPAAAALMLAASATLLAFRRPTTRA